MPRQMHYPKVVGIRLSQADGEKLTRLCNYCNRAPSELMRLLIRTAQPVDVPPVRFVHISDSEQSHV